MNKYSFLKIIGIILVAISVIAALILILCGIALYRIEPLYSTIMMGMLFISSICLTIFIQKPPPAPPRRKIAKETPITSLIQSTLQFKNVLTLQNWNRS